MKSIKPGRGPSALNFAGSIIAIIFGVFWTIGAYSMTQELSGFDMIFPLFGILFIAAGVGTAIYNFKNMTGKERMSIIDIVDEEEEGDPLNRRFGHSPSQQFCPYCGTKIEKDFSFCPKCGKKVEMTN